MHDILIILHFGYNGLCTDLACNYLTRWQSVIFQECWEPQLIKHGTITVDEHYSRQLRTDSAENQGIFNLSNKNDPMPDESVTKMFLFYLNTTTGIWCILTNFTNKHDVNHLKLTCNSMTTVSWRLLLERCNTAAVIFVALT